jgi:hypothetical protein
MKHDSCPTCGIKLGPLRDHGQMRRCDACRRPNPRGFNYCGFCASPLENTAMRAEMSKLAAHLASFGGERLLYILDEPTTGLHFDDIAKLLAALRKLVEAGHTLVVIEHNLDVIKTADWVIDLGPEGGEGGGNLVTAGTPEQVAQVEASYTGRALRHVLATSRSKHVQPAS